MLAGHITPGQRLVGVFVFAVLVPGVVLSGFAARALWQERDLAQRQLRDRLDYAADAVARALEAELDRISAAATSAPQGWPRDGSWALADGDGIHPQGVLPYEFRVAPHPFTFDPALEAAKTSEANGLGPARLVDVYKKLLDTAASPNLPEVRHRLALALLHSGRGSEAVRLWKEIEKSGGSIGSLPAALVAGFEVASIEPAAAEAFYRKLTSGQWRLEKARYLYYSGEMRRRVAADSQEDRALRLADAVEAGMAGGSAPGYVVFRSESPKSALILSHPFLQTRLVPLLNAVGDSDLRLARITVDGDTLFETSSTEPHTSRQVNRAGTTWGVEVEPVNAASFIAAHQQRTTLYLALLVLVLLGLSAGGYMTIRGVHRELEVARLKAEFVSTVSHEFRSPLTGIRQFGEMLAEGRVTSEEKRQQYYELIVRESERLGRLVENVLDFSRMEDGRREYRFEPLETTAWLRAVTEEFRGEAMRTGCGVEATIPDGLPAIAGDAVALSTAVRNLLDNAVKYSPAGSTVWLDAEDVGDGIRIRVRDRGAGIPEREQTQIFDKFYRGGGEMSKKVKGAGLGLSLVRHIVEAHRGRITVES